MAKVSLEKEKIKILLLEGLHPSSVEVLQAAGYTNIEYHKGSLSEEELIEAVKDTHFIGIRSRTNLSEEVINAANKLVAIGCFCIGTNQVDLGAAAKTWHSCIQCTVFKYTKCSRTRAWSDSSAPSWDS